MGIYILFIIINITYDIFLIIWNLVLFMGLFHLLTDYLSILFCIEIKKLFIFYLFIFELTVKSFYKLNIRYIYIENYGNIVLSV